MGRKSNYEKNKGCNFECICAKLEENEKKLNELKKTIDEKSREIIQGEIEDSIREDLKKEDIERKRNFTWLAVLIEFQKYAVEWEMNFEGIMDEIESIDKMLKKYKSKVRVEAEDEEFEQIQMIEDEKMFVPTPKLIKGFETLDALKMWGVDIDKWGGKIENRILRENTDLLNMYQKQYQKKYAMEVFDQMDDEIVYVIANNIDIFMDIPLTAIQLLNVWYLLQDDVKEDVLEALKSVTNLKVHSKNPYEIKLDFMNIKDYRYKDLESCKDALRTDEEMKPFWSKRKEEREEIVSAWRELALNVTIRETVGNSKFNQEEIEALSEKMLDEEIINFFLKYENDNESVLDENEKTCYKKKRLTAEQESIIMFINDISIYEAYKREKKEKNISLHSKYFKECENMENE